jgi:hypothetical protein
MIAEAFKPVETGNRSDLTRPMLFAITARSCTIALVLYLFEALLLAPTQNFQLSMPIDPVLEPLEEYLPAA